MTQEQAYNLLLMGVNVFLTGQAGSGKTYLLNKYIQFLKDNKIPTAITATTGIAATHIGGITIHSWSGIAIKSSLSTKHLTQILNNSKLTKQIESAKVLIIDEISMLHSYRLDMISEICKQVRGNTKPFGGIQVILCGDFFQLPPIVEDGFQKTSFAYEANAWQELNLKVCYLDEQHRQQDEEFTRLLNDIRSQDISEATFELLSTRINQPIKGNVVPTKLYTHNADVDSINNLELGKIKKPERHFFMFTKGDKKLVETLIKSCLAPQDLALKEGAAVMFVKNNQQKGYINGTLGTVVAFDKEDGHPIVQTNSGKQIVATPTTWEHEVNDVVLAQISQIPLRLAWAITVHKSQGMSLDLAEIDLSKTFALGMGYVALSRVRALSGIKLLGINQMAFMVDPDVGEFDKELKKSSAALVQNLAQMPKQQVKTKQKQHLQKILPAESNINKADKMLEEAYIKYFG